MLPSVPDDRPSHLLHLLCQRDIHGSAHRDQKVTLADGATGLCPLSFISSLISWRASCKVAQSVSSVFDLLAKDGTGS